MMAYLFSIYLIFIIARHLSLSQTSISCAFLSVHLHVIQIDFMYTLGVFRTLLIAIFSLLRADASVPLSYRVESGYLASL